MSIDFERDLAELLHAVTPEPPDYLEPPPVAVLPETTRADAGATVIDLETRTGHAPRHRHRWPPLVAAAAVAALAAGVVAITQIGNTAHPTTAHQSAATGKPTTMPTAVSRCRDNQVVLGTGPDLATHRHAGTEWFTYSNRWAKRCALPHISVAIGKTPFGGTPFPASAETVLIPGHGKVVFTAHVRVAGRCHTVDRNGLRMNVTVGDTGGSWPLGVAGCTLTPLRVTRRVVS